MTRRQGEVLGVLREVAAEHGVTVEDILSHKHHSDIVQARTEATQALYQSGITVGEIAPILGKAEWTVYWYLRGRR